MPRDPQEWILTQKELMVSMQGCSTLPQGLVETSRIAGSCRFHLLWIFPCSCWPHNPRSDVAGTDGLRSSEALLTEWVKSVGTKEFQHLGCFCIYIHVLSTLRPLQYYKILSAHLTRTWRLVLCRVGFLICSHGENKTKQDHTCALFELYLHQSQWRGMYGVQQN